MGPVYCETPSVIASFPAEPLNTWSNLVIIGFGILALVLIARYGKGKKGLWILGILLVVNGVGSFLWHGFRTSGFLILDSVPGALFLLVCAYLWLRRFYSFYKTLLLFILFIGVELVAEVFGSGILPAGFFFVPLAPAIVLLGALLIAATSQVSSRAALLGTFAIISSLIALLFRSIDESVCAAFPLGTHFLWHIFLSLGAFLAVVTLLTIDRHREEAFHSKLQMDVHR